MKTLNLLHLILQFIPTADQRKEKRRLDNKLREQKLNKQRSVIEQKMKEGVHMSAFDPWAIRRRKATFVNRVVIRTDVELPKRVWLKVHKLLVQAVQEEKERRKSVVK